MLSSFKIRDYRVFWFGLTFSLIGTWVQSTAQSWLVFNLTHSAFLLGVVGFLSLLPVSLFSFAAGVYVDRCVKRNLLILTQVLFMILAFSLATMIRMEVVTVTQIMGIALLNGMILSIDAPARQALIVDLVGKRHLLNAIALNSAAFHGARIIGPALAGVLIAWIGMAGCFYVNAFSFLPFLFALFLIRPKPAVPVAYRKGFKQEAMEALRFIKGHELISSLLCVVGLVSFFGISYIILMPVFTHTIYRADVGGLGFLMSANGLGALAGALRLARLKEGGSKLKMLKFSLLIFFVAVMCFALSRSLLLSCVFLLLVGYGGVSSIAMANTLLQINVPDAYRGRVMGAFMVMFTGVMPFGNLLAGFLASFFGAQATVFFGSALSLVIFIHIERRHLRHLTSRAAAA